MTGHSKICCTALVLLVSTVIEARAGMMFQGLGDLPGGPHESAATAISGDGHTVLGIGDTDFRADFGTEAFVWTSETGTRRLGTGGALTSLASGIARNGSIVGGVSTFSSTEAVRFDGLGGIQRLGFLPNGGFSSTASDVSGDGETVVGTARDPAGTQAMIYDRSNGMRGLGDLPGGTFFSQASAISDDGSVVVGTGQTDTGNEAFRWDAVGGMRGLGTFSGYTVSAASDISADGTTIVGSVSNPAFGGVEAFVWDEMRGMRGIGQLSIRGRSSRAAAVSADGSVIVGTSIIDGGDSRAFIYDETNGMRVLQDVLALGGVDLAGWTLQGASAISDDGLTIAGIGVGPNGVEAWIATIPEPSTCLLIGLGLAVISRLDRSSRLRSEMIH